MLLLVLPLGGQPDESALALSLRSNVVAIRSARAGFGFIVGERAGQLYVVTARHILFPTYPPDPGVAPAPTKLRFYSDQGNTYDARVLGTNDAAHDLAVLTVPNQSVAWNRSALAPASALKRGTRVWFVGRNESWFVPVQPGAIVNDAPFRDSRIEADGVPVRVGTSGAPLIAANGIVGMILSDDADDTRALSVDFIQASFRDWAHPFDLRLSSAPVVDTPPQTECTVPVRSTPSGAEVTIDGINRGTTPTEVRLTQGQRYSLNLEKSGYVFSPRSIDCNSRSVSVSGETTSGNIRLQYGGDLYSCAVNIRVTIADRTFTPTGTDYAVRNVPLGEQRYRITGTIMCPTIGSCSASGSGSINVEDDASFNVVWRNTSFARCSVELQ